MARLSAHGYEIYRLSKSARIENDPKISEEVLLAAIMSDGYLLFCRRLHMKPTRHRPKAHWRNLGWRVQLNGNKVRRDKERMEKWSYTPELMRDGLLELGYVLERVYGKPVEHKNEEAA